MDFAYETVGITLSYTFELSLGSEADIARIAAEAFAAIAVIAQS